jgi:hypothetical protein
LVNLYSKITEIYQALRLEEPVAESIKTVEIIEDGVEVEVDADAAVAEMFILDLTSESNGINYQQKKKEGV